MSLSHGVTAACLSRDNHLLLAVGTRIQEVRLVEEESSNASWQYRGKDENKMWNQRQSLPGEMRQCHLGQGQMLDPVVAIKETGNMAVVALTK